MDISNQYENIYIDSNSPHPTFGSPIPNFGALTSVPQSLQSVSQGILSSIPITHLHKSNSESNTLNINQLVSLADSKIEIDDDDELDELTLKRNLLNAIDFESRKNSLQKLRLQQLHLHYKTKLKELAALNRVYKEEINILKNIKNEKELNEILTEKQIIRAKIIAQQQERQHDENQLAHTTKENQKLTIIIHYLSRSLSNLVTQYQALSNENNINNGLTTNNYYSQNPQLMYDVTQAIQQNPWFQNIMEENRMIERHIRFLKHIIEEENRRTKVQEMMLNQSKSNKLDDDMTSDLKETELDIKNYNTLLPIPATELYKNISNINDDDINDDDNKNEEQLSNVDIQQEYDSDDCKSPIKQQNSPTKKK